MSENKNKAEGGGDEPSVSPSSPTKEGHTKKVEWSEENEQIMVEWCDVAQVYKWLNARANSKYSYMHAWFTIPAIILSTISGTASFAQTSLPIDYQVYAPMAIGSLNIFIGILTTVQQYLKISELNESHRVASISWDKFSRNIRIELAKKPKERTEAGTFLKICRQEFDRLMETSPMIPPKIVEEFISTFQGKKGSIERQRFDRLKKPDICNIIVSADETRHRSNSNELFDFDNGRSMEFEKEVLGKEEKIKNLQLALKKREWEDQKRALETNRNETEQALYLRNLQEQNEMRKKKQFKLIDDFIKAFAEAWGRNPMPDEIVVHTRELEEEIDEDVLSTYLENYMTSEV